MLHLNSLQVAVAIVALCAAYDRLCGWRLNGLKRIALTGVLGLAFWSLGFAPMVAGLLAVGVYAWRSRPFGKLLNPSRQDFGPAVVRHLWALFVLPGLLFGGAALLPSILLLLAFAVAAALLARLHHIIAEQGRDINAFIEIARGALLGAVIALSIPTT